VYEAQFSASRENSSARDALLALAAVGDVHGASAVWMIQQPSGETNIIRYMYYMGVHCNASYRAHTAMHYTQCTALHCTALHCTVLHCTALHCTALHCTVSHSITHTTLTAIHCSTLCIIIAHHTTPHRTTLHSLMSSQDTVQKDKYNCLLFTLYHCVIMLFRPSYQQ
jgi:hypothetical protein